MNVTKRAAPSSPSPTSPGTRTPVIEAPDGFASLAHFQHSSESYQLHAGIRLDREALRPGAKATIMVRPTPHRGRTTHLADTSREGPPGPCFDRPRRHLHHQHGKRLQDRLRPGSHSRDPGSQPSLQPQHPIGRRCQGGQPGAEGDRALRRPGLHDQRTASQRPDQGPLPEQGERKVHRSAPRTKRRAWRGATSLRHDPTAQFQEYPELHPENRQVRGR